MPIADNKRKGEYAATLSRHERRPALCRCYRGQVNLRHDYLVAQDQGCPEHAFEKYLDWLAIRFAISPVEFEISRDGLAKRAVVTVDGKTERMPLEKAHELYVEYRELQRQPMTERWFPGKGENDG